MTRTRAGRVSALVATMVAVSACGPFRVRTAPDHNQDLIVLLPDDGGTVGRAAVSNRTGSVDLTEARSATRVALNQAPTRVTILSESDTRQIFGDALAAMPMPPRHFMLFFRFDSEELTEESKAVVQDVLQTIKARQAPDVVVLGHTDTTGTSAKNFELGSRRANTVRALLADAGLNTAAIEVMSHGEAELLVHTADDVFEPKNRRVEVTIR